MHQKRFHNLARAPLTTLTGSWKPARVMQGSVINESSKDSVPQEALLSRAIR